MRKLITAYYIQLIVPFIAFEEQHEVLRFFQLSVKVTFKQRVKNNYGSKFLIFFVFTLVLFLEQETKEEQIVQSVYLYILAAVGNELTTTGTCPQSFNP